MADSGRVSDGREETRLKGRPGSDGAYARLLRLATWASVVTAALLIVVKLGAWLLTGSVSVLASLADSLMDILASTLNLLAVRLSLRPPDDEHRFGHGKAEALAGLGQAAFIAGSALFLSLHAIDRLRHPQPIQDIGVGIGVMVFAILVTAALMVLQRYVIRKTGSTAIRADALHYASDLLTNLSIIAALGLAAFGYPGLDPVFGLGIAAYILYSAWTIGRQAVDILMDRELDSDTQVRIETLARQCPQVLGVHSLRTRQSGQTLMVQLHLELNSGLSLKEAHGIGQVVSGAIRRDFPTADVLIHHDPVP